MSPTKRVVVVKIPYDSEGGRGGGAFAKDLLAKEPAPKEGDSPASGAHSGTFARAPRVKPLVLAVDDSSIAIARLRELLGGAGYEVLSADNGNAAIALAQKLRPDVVLLDIDMPGKSGIEVCEVLKKDPRTWRQLVILLTASDEAVHLRDGFRAGCDGFIQKGTGDAELLRKLKVKLLPSTSLPGRIR